MKAAELLNAQSVLTGRLDHTIQRIGFGHDGPDTIHERDALTLALRLIDKELGVMLRAAGAGDAVLQYTQGTITLNELCNKIVEIATNLK